MVIPFLSEVYLYKRYKRLLRNTEIENIKACLVQQIWNKRK